MLGRFTSSVVRKRIRWQGTAPDQKTAIERAQKEFPLSAEQKKQLMAPREV
jgi:hypothetical protein